MEKSILPLAPKKSNSDGTHSGASAKARVTMTASTADFTWPLNSGLSRSFGLMIAGASSLPTDSRHSEPMTMTMPS